MAKRNMPTEDDDVPYKKEVTPVRESPIVERKLVKYVVCRCKRLNIRKGPTKESLILFSVPEDTVLNVNAITAEKEWLQVILNDEGTEKGYVLKEFTRRA